MKVISQIFVRLQEDNSRSLNYKAEAQQIAITTTVKVQLGGGSNTYPFYGYNPTGTANIFRKMVGLPEAAWNKEYENKTEGDDKSYLHSSRSNVQQLDHNSNQSTLSDFMT